MGDTIRILIAVGIVLVLLTLYFGSYLLNKRTKRPEGCEDLTASCTGCAITTCGHNESVEE